MLRPRDKLGHRAHQGLSGAGGETERARRLGALEVVDVHDVGRRGACLGVARCEAHDVILDHHLGLCRHEHVEARLTGSDADADDLVQETYMKAWRFMDHYEEGSNAKAWLFKICRNAFINDYRTKKAQPYKVDYEDIVVYHNEDDPVNPGYYDLHEEMYGKLMGDEVARAINALSAGSRLVVLLDLEDFTYQEIAAIANIPIGTVRSRLHRARTELADKLRAYAETRGFNVADDDKTIGSDSISA